MQNNTHGIKTIFDAVPDRLVSDQTGLYQKSSKKNLYYIIIGYQSLLTNEYFVNYYILNNKPASSKKFCREQVKTKKHGLEVFQTKTQVMEFIYNFLESFSEHERILNTFSPKPKTMSFDLFIEDVAEWVKKIILIFGEHA